MKNEEQEPKLAPPGAGLPFPENLVARYIIFPLQVRAKLPEVRLEEFGTMAKEILGVCKSLSEEALFKRVLVKRLQGLEDSSRYWSPLMVVHHLLIVGTQIEAGILGLAAGKIPTMKADTAKVKPNAEAAKVILEDYRIFSENHADKIKPVISGLDLSLKFEHPWFGPLNGIEWIALNTFHQGIHFRQLKAILG